MFFGRAAGAAPREPDRHQTRSLKHNRISFPSHATRHFTGKSTPPNCLHTSVIDYEKLLPVSGHAHYRSRQAEHLSLNTADGEETHQHGAGGRRHPASSQTQRPRVLAFRKVCDPLLVCVPRGEVQALQLAGKNTADSSRSRAGHWNYHATLNRTIKHHREIKMCSFIKNSRHGVNVSFA